MTEVISTWQRFAEITIKTNDLDPMYEVIYKLNKTKSRKWMGVFLMTFLLYYDAGQAIKLANASESPTAVPYWAHLKNIASTYPSGPWSMKRGTERRHMRGENERKALEKLASFNMEPWELLMYMIPLPIFAINTPTYTQFYKRMETVFAGTQFGPYFIWKLYDIFNVCLDIPISMSKEEALKYMPAEPIKVLLHFGNEWNLVNSDALDRIQAYMSTLDHPVLPGRKCSYAETETILCMIKGFFLTKTHVVGDDIYEKRVQLEAYPEVRDLLPTLTNKNDYARGELIV